MDIREIFEKPLILKPEERVSKAISEMHQKKKHEALVMEGKELLGVLVARDLVKRKINTPDKTTIKKFIRKTNPLLPGSSIEDVMNSMMVNDFKCVLIKDEKGEIFFITKLGMLSQVKNNKEFKDKNASDIMVPPYCIDSGDSLATALSIIRFANISRVPVVDEKNSVLGVLDTLDLLKASIKMSKASIGEKSGEHIKLRDVFASSFMDTNIQKIAPDTSIRNVINTMIQKETETILIEKNNKLVGIITPKLILKLIGKNVSGIRVQISGIGDEEMFIRSVIDKQLRNAVKKMSRFIPLEFLVLRIDRHHKTGKRAKYSVKATLATRKGTFYANDFSWDLTKAIRGILNKFEKEVIKRKDHLIMGKVGKTKDL